MSLMSEEIREETLKFLGEMKHAVRVIVFTQEFECQYCTETRSLLEEVAALSDKIELQVFDFQKDENEVKKYGIDKIPAVVIEGEVDYGIRYFGIPAGYEFSALIEDIELVSRGETDLTDTTRQALKSLSDPVHIQVFVTPT